MKVLSVVKGEREQSTEREKEKRVRLITATTAPAAGPATGRRLFVRCCYSGLFSLVTVFV